MSNKNCGCGSYVERNNANDTIGAGLASVACMQGVCHRHARDQSLTVKYFKGSKILEYL